MRMLQHLHRRFKAYCKVVLCVVRCETRKLLQELCKEPCEDGQQDKSHLPSWQSSKPTPLQPLALKLCVPRSAVMIRLLVMSKPSLP